MLIRLAFCSICELDDDLSVTIDSLPFGENEKTRLRSIKNETAKRESLAALLALRKLCGDAALTILRDGQGRGKPYFSEEGAPHFSLSHAGGVAVAAVCDVSEVGVDLETVRDSFDQAAVARRFFTASEQEEFSRNGDFFALWTRKEARAKCLGASLSAVLSEDISLPARTYRANGITLSLAAEREFEVEFLNHIFLNQEVLL